MKKILCLALSLLLILGLAGCGETYEDTNGPDDCTLQTLTDENIINQDTGSSGLAYKETSLAGITSQEYSSNNFNGVERLYLTNYIMKSDVHIYVSYINVKSGNFKLAAVLDDEIFFEFPLDTFSEDFYFEDIKGTFQIIAAGESAEVEFFYEIH